MNLLIVESPGKVKKIQGFLGNDWKVAASVGHVRDLPKDGNNDGICPPDFKPNYTILEGKEHVIGSLSKLSKDAQQVYLATDPDREGEAIAWHLKEALKLKYPLRVTYTEITESAVKKAISNPREIDMQLVNAQEARRVLDRLFGYKVRPVVNASSGEKFTTGRVQSPALRLVVERELAIRNFKSTTHFGVDLFFADGWKASWNAKNWIDSDQVYFLDKDTAKKIAELHNLIVASYVESENKQAPPAPFTTSSLQQAANNALKINPKETMELAQKLYENGHITYMRTDSPNLSEEAINEIRDLASKKGWPLPQKPRMWKSKDGAQEAHEAIRPIHFEEEEAGENDNQKALYKLIRLRALASQLDDAVYATTKVVLETELDDKKVVFEAKGNRLISSGWLMLQNGDQTEDPEKEDEPANPIPALNEGAQIVASSGELKTKKTSPPPRFSQASLVQELERKGIGRPSTYASILDNIMTRDYVRENKRKLEATAQGEKLISCLTGNFDFVEYDFTKNMEIQLDDIAEGKSDYLTVVKGANNILEKEIGTFVEKSCVNCPDCGSLVKHWVGTSSKTGKPYNFWSCSNQECGSKFLDDEGKLGVKQINKSSIPLSEHKCIDCGNPLRHMVKEGENGYNFWGCSGYPDCKSSYKDDDGKPGEKKGASAPASKYKCSNCQKPLIRRQGTSKTSGKEYDFFGCSDRACNAIYSVKEDGKPNFDAKKKSKKK